EVALRGVRTEPADHDGRERPDAKRGQDRPVDEGEALADPLRGHAGSVAAAPTTTPLPTRHPLGQTGEAQRTGPCPGRPGATGIGTGGTSPSRCTSRG